MHHLSTGSPPRGPPRNAPEYAHIEVNRQVVYRHGSLALVAGCFSHGWVMAARSWLLLTVRGFMVVTIGVFLVVWPHLIKGWQIMVSSNHGGRYQDQQWWPIMASIGWWLLPVVQAMVFVRQESSKPVGMGWHGGRRTILMVMYADTKPSKIGISACRWRLSQRLCFYRNGSEIKSCACSFERMPCWNSLETFFYECLHWPSLVWGLVHLAYRVIYHGYI